MRVTLILPLACGMLAAPALGNSYDDCILGHMGTAQNEVAVEAIERACIAKTSISIPPNEVVNFAGGLNASAGQFNTGYSLEYGLSVEFKNTTNYNVTEVVVLIHDKETNQITEYPVDTFSAPLPLGTIVTKRGEPAFTQIILSGKTRNFFVHVTEVNKNTITNFGTKFSWGVTPTKGIPAN